MTHLSLPPDRASVCVHCLVHLTEGRGWASKPPSSPITSGNTPAIIHAQILGLQGNSQKRIYLPALEFSRGAPNVPPPPSHLNSPTWQSFPQPEGPGHPSPLDCCDHISVWSLHFLLVTPPRVFLGLLFYLGPLCCGRFCAPWGSGWVVVGVRSRPEWTSNSVSLSSASSISR